MANLTVKDWRPINSGSLLGSCTVETKVFRFRDVSIIRGEKGVFAGMPSKVLVDKNDQVLKDENGKRRYMTVVEFVEKPTGYRFSDDVIEALRAQGISI